MTLKYENTAEIGDTIRAYDFEPMPGRRDRYVEGVVKAKGSVSYGYDAFTIEVTEDVAFPADDNRVGLNVYAPFESDLDYDGRVVLIKKARDEDAHGAYQQLLVDRLETLRTAVLALEEVQETVPMMVEAERAAVDTKLHLNQEIARTNALLAADRKAGNS